MRLSRFIAVSLLSAGLVSTWAKAQGTTPPPQPRLDRRDDQPPPRQDRRDDQLPPMQRPDRPERDRMDGDRMMDQPRPGMGRPGPLMEQVERLRNWLELVDRYARMARNPVDAGIAAVINANDLLRPRGTQAAIDYFNKLLSEVKNDAVQRAIRLQLVELYRSGGQEEKALEQLRTLMIAAPAGEVPDGPVRERPAQR